MRLPNTPLLIILIFLTIISVSDKSYSQTFSKFGIKAGFITTGLSTFNEKSPYTLDNANLYVNDKSDYFNFLSFDVGIYAELFNSEEFSVSTELHYLVKGETDKAAYTVPHLLSSNFGENVWETGEISDKAGFVSFQILPRYRAGISKEGEDDVYFFAGPVFNFMVNDDISATQPKYIEKIGFPGDIGIALGLGYEVNRKFMLELKLDYGLTGSYNFVYGNDKVKRSFNTFSVLTGLALSEFF
jgi:Outer membrane protein beta-barrel domain